MSSLLLERLVPDAVADLTAYIPPEGGCPVKLDANESPFSLPETVQDEIKNALSMVFTNRYPDPASVGLREAFADLYDCGPEHVMAGNGSDELIALLLWTFRKGQNGSAPRILVPVPTFAMYSISAKAAGYDVIEVPFGPGMVFQREPFLEKMDECDPNIVFLSNPNNPTGTLIQARDLELVLSRSKGLVVIDEAYADFSLEPSWCGRVVEHENLVVLRTLSKVGGAAFRCGFMAAGCHVIGEVDKVRQPFNVNSVTQAAGEAVLRGFPAVQEQVKAVVAERDRVTSALGGLGIDTFPSRANFLLVRAGGQEERLWGFLQEGGIVVKFLPRLGVAGDCLRITVGTPGENDALLARTGLFQEGEKL